MDLAALYDAWAPRLLAYMMTITRDRHRAEDALQNLFVKLAVSQPEIRNPAVYLFRAARREAIRSARRRRMEPLGPLEFLIPVTIPGAPVELADLTSALGSLPPEQQEIVILHGIEGFTFKEAGEIVGAPLETVASRYRYAIDKLRGLLEP